MEARCNRRTIKRQDRVPSRDLDSVPLSSSVEESIKPIANMCLSSCPNKTEYVKSSESKSFVCHNSVDYIGPSEKDFAKRGHSVYFMNHGQLVENCNFSPRRRSTGSPDTLDPKELLTFRHQLSCLVHARDKPLEDCELPSCWYTSKPEISTEDWIGQNEFVHDTSDVVCRISNNVVIADGDSEDSITNNNPAVGNKRNGYMEMVDETNENIVVHRTKHYKALHKFPRESLEKVIMRQDCEFECNPDFKHYPLRLNSRSSIEFLDCEEPKTGLRSFFHRFISRQDSTDFTVCHRNDTHVKIQHPEKTGHELFGARIETVASGDNQYFHVLILNKDENSMARQLKFKNHDEILMVNGEVVFNIDQHQLLMKFWYLLRENNQVSFVARRMVRGSQRQFEFEEIVATFSVQGTCIRSSNSSQYFSMFNKVKRMEKKIKPFCSEQYVYVQNGQLGLTLKANSSAVFTIGRKWSFGQFSFVCLCYIKHNDSGKYIKVKKDSLCLSSKSPDLKRGDARIFILKTYSRNDSVCSFESTLKPGHYISCNNWVLTIRSSDRPKQERDLVFFEIDNP